MTDHTEPVDRLMAECLTARNTINAHAARIRTGIHAWQPKPCPPQPKPCPPSPTHPETGERK